MFDLEAIQREADRLSGRSSVISNQPSLAGRLNSHSEQSSLSGRSIASYERCPYCDRLCLVITAGTAKNAGRKFISCKECDDPERGRFVWCDHGKKCKKCGRLLLEQKVMSRRKGNYGRRYGTCIQHPTVFRWL
jgi:hypothetical protein